MTVDLNANHCLLQNKSVVCQLACSQVSSIRWQHLHLLYLAHITYLNLLSVDIFLHKFPLQRMPVWCITDVQRCILGIPKQVWILTTNFQTYRISLLTTQDRWDRCDVQMRCVTGEIMQVTWCWCVIIIIINKIKINNSLNKK